jgi:hypothetical protein
MPWLNAHYNISGFNSQQSDSIVFDWDSCGVRSAIAGVISIGMNVLEDTLYTDYRSEGLQDFFNSLKKCSIAVRINESITKIILKYPHT